MLLGKQDYSSGRKSEIITGFGKNVLIKKNTRKEVFLQLKTHAVVTLT